MLSFILISLVLPCLVLSCADRFSFIFFTRSHSGPLRPSLCITYIIASSHAWSYAFVTSKNTMYAGFPWLLISFMTSFRIARWSVVAFPFWPPAWFSVMFILFLALLFNILSNSFPKLLAMVMPLSFEHIPLFPFPLYSLIIWSFWHCSGISLLLAMVCSISLYISTVWDSAFVNVSFGISSGPVALPFFRVFMDFSIAFSSIRSISSFISSDSDSVLIVFFISFVHSSNCGLPSRAW